MINILWEGVHAEYNENTIHKIVFISEQYVPWDLMLHSVVIHLFEEDGLVI